MEQRKRKSRSSHKDEKPTKEILSPTWGSAYVKAPRMVLDKMFSAHVTERRKGRLLIALLSFAYFKEGFVQHNGRSYHCMRGELVCCAADLCERAEIKQWVLYKMLNQLVEEQIILTQRIAHGIRIRIIGYDLLMKNFEYLASPAAAHPSDESAMGRGSVLHGGKNSYLPQRSFRLDMPSEESDEEGSQQKKS